ncbi:MAG: MATE family efflux transporter, partial [Planctomycetaceae bacterium]|nr:MATE family efflux transporter [Planctomycetaceae bacterium]
GGGGGMVGAALATGIGYCVPALVGFWYFLGKRGGTLRFARPRFRGAVLLEASVNGSSEMVTNLAFSVVTFLFNRQMMRQVGVDGVAAMTIVLYVEFLLSAVYFGYSSGVAPLFSYQYGKGDTGKLKLLFRNSLFIMGICSIAAVLVGQFMAGNLVAIFASRDSVVYDIALHGFRLFSLAYLIMGFNIFTSALFTALSNGKVSAFLSFMRIFVFISLGILTLPHLLGVNGVWLAVPVAEVFTLMLSILCLRRYRGVYHFA